MLRITRAADCHTAWISSQFVATSVPASDTLTITCNFNMLWNRRRSEGKNFMKILDTTGQFLVRHRWFSGRWIPDRNNMEEGVNSNCKCTTSLFGKFSP